MKRVTNQWVCNFIALLSLILLVQGCAGTIYQPYDGRLGYQEKSDSKGRLVITYFASDTTDWFTIAGFVDQRILERRAEDPCTSYTLVRDEQSEQKVTVKRTQDAQYTTIIGLKNRWDIRTHEPINLEIPAYVRVYQRILKPNKESACTSQSAD